MEHIAQDLGQDPVDVKLRNCITTDPTETIIKAVMEKSDYTARKTAVDDFNSVSFWHITEDVGHTD